jgi:transketolase
VLADPPEGDPQVILIATGSEVHVALGAYEQLTSEGIRARVVSLPCWELFEKQPKDYHDEVLPPHITARVASEQATTLGWERFVGTTGAVVGMETFGASAPLKALASKFGFTPEAVARVAKQQIADPSAPQ